MYRGRKFNSKKEAVKGSEGKYLGIQRWRFYIKCSACSRPMTFLTDPQHNDYECESGGTRTYEVHKDQKKTEEEIVEQDAKTEKEDPMKALENRVLQSQREMKDIDNLDEILAMNRKHVRMMKNGNEIDMTDEILKAKHGEKIEHDRTIELDEDDEALIKSIKFASANPMMNKKINRLTESEELEDQRRREQELEILQRQQQEIAEKVKEQKQEKNGTLNPLIKIKRKRKLETDKTDIASKDLKFTKLPEPSKPPALGMLAAYSDSDDSD